ncbi:MAG TPA: hypothetical protein VGO62_10240, partial [Myxococcota bacterium]
ARDAAASSPLVPARHSPRLRLVARATAGAGLLAAAAVLVVMVRGSDGERSKGGAGALTFSVLHDGVARAGSDGEIVHPGDALRFSVRTPSRAYVAVISSDGGGAVSAYFPVDGAALPLVNGAEDLPAATALDDVLGRETLTAFFCDRAVPAGALVDAVKLASAVPGCVTDRAHIVKTAALP